MSAPSYDKSEGSLVRIIELGLCGRSQPIRTLPLRMGPRGSSFGSYFAAFCMYLLISVKCTQEKLSVVARFIIHPEGLRQNDIQ